MTTFAEAEGSWLAPPALREVAIAGYIAAVLRLRDFSYEHRLRTSFWFIAAAFAAGAALPRPPSP